MPGVDERIGGGRGSRGALGRMMEASDDLRRRWVSNGDALRY